MNLLNKNITYIDKIVRIMGNKSTNNYAGDQIYKDLFVEIESIIAFFKINFIPCNKLVVQFDYGYHFMKMYFTYLYTSLDKIACLLFYHFCSENINHEEFNKKINIIYFHRIDPYLENNKSINIKLYEKINSIINSESFTYIKKIRNSANHNFKNPMLRYHFSTDLMICFIISVKLIINLNILIK